MNLGKFVDDCLKNVDENNFSSFKNRHIQDIENKVKGNKNQLKEYDFKLLEEQRRKEELKKDIFKQILDKKIRIKEEQKEIEKNLQKVINTQPSTRFVNQTFKDHFKCFQELNKVEESFSAHPSLISQLKAKTRFNANPVHKDTFYMINQDPRGSSHITEKERFNISSNNLTDFVKFDKEKKRLKELAKLNSIRKYENMRKEACKTMEKIFEQRDISCQNKRAARKYEYELLNKKRNEFVE
jgi:hypothetical protein